MKFLLDENLSPLHTRTVRDLGHDAVSVVEIGLSGADDQDVRAAAIQLERVLLTPVRISQTCTGIRRREGIVRLRLHPAVEEAIDAMLRRAIPRLAGSGPGSAMAINGSRADSTNFNVDGFDDRNSRGAAAQYHASRQGRVEL